MADEASGRNIFGSVERRNVIGYNDRMAADSQGFSGVVRLADMAATARLGARIAAGLSIGDTVALSGDLGAGKTTLARAILQALDVGERVPSPTFTLVQSYDTPKLVVRHYDLYRLEDPREMDELGLDEALDEGVALIEWPEHAGNRLPPDRLHIHLETITGDQREARMQGPSRWADIFS
jgi:tRNA threonylcarbamoyl adenosine modification protein YjeE